MMAHVEDPHYTFNYVGHDGEPYSRAVYWDALYAFSVSKERLLAADRILPHSTVPWALYLAMKGRNRESKQKLLTDTAYRDLPLVGKVADIVVASAEDDFGSLLVPDSQHYPIQVSSLPPLTIYPVAGGTDPTSSGDGISSIYKAAEIAGITNRDVALVELGNRTHAEIERQIDDSVKAGAETTALVPRSQTIDDLYLRLYGDPRCIKLITEVIDAKGGYDSKLVTSFLSFCLRQIHHHADLGTTFREERLDAILGRAEAHSTGFLPYHHVTVLGYVVAGGLEVNRKDPERTARSYQVDPGVDPGSIVLGEVGRRISRAVIKRIVKTALSHNIRDVVFVDELPIGASEVRR